jgi:hypothetical protein
LEHHLGFYWSGNATPNLLCDIILASASRRSALHNCGIIHQSPRRSYGGLRNSPLGTIYSPHLG